LNAGAFYGAQHLVLGGDITGKTLVPIEKTSSGWRVVFNGQTYADLTDREVGELEDVIGAVGQYPVRGERDELLALQDDAEGERAFIAAVVAQMERWVEIAETRLRGTGIRCYVAPGNDDFWEIDGPLQSSDIVEFAEGTHIRLDERFETITTGYSNVTPWHTPRELGEADLRRRLDAMFAEVKDPGALIVVFHPPPYDTELDKAPALDEEFRLKRVGGQPDLIPVGSIAVREFIEENQPLLGLHGHVHASRGAQRLGRTLCLNPGSEYTEGTLCGALVTLGENEPTFQFVNG
jgi:Icc-related predicted phosphoesterase